MKVKNLLIRLTATVVGLVHTAFADEFSARIVDGLKRPVEGVVVKVIWHRPEGKGQDLPILTLRSDAKGMVRGDYDKKSMTGDGYACVELSKEGYGYRSDSHEIGPFQAEYILGRAFRVADLERIAPLDLPAKARELKEVLAGEFQTDELLDRALFKAEHQFRPALVELVTDRDVGPGAISVLSLIAVPEDLARVVRHLPPPSKEWLENRWACEVAGAMLEPTTDEEWAFLERCARDAYDDPAVVDSAITSLRLIASPRSRQVLEALRPKDEDVKAAIAWAIAELQANPKPLEDRDLATLGRKVAAVIRAGKLLEIDQPEYNQRRDKALVDLSFGRGRESIVFTATCHSVGGVWKLRGLRLFSLGTLAVPVEAEEDKYLHPKD